MWSITNGRDPRTSMPPKTASRASRSPTAAPVVVTVHTGRCVGSKVSPTGLAVRRRYVRHGRAKSLFRVLGHLLRFVPRILTCHVVSQSGLPVASRAGRDRGGNRPTHRPPLFEGRTWDHIRHPPGEENGSPGPARPCAGPRSSSLAQPRLPNRGGPKNWRTRSEGAPPA